MLCSCLFAAPTVAMAMSPTGMPAMDSPKMVAAMLGAGSVLVAGVLGLVALSTFNGQPMAKLAFGLLTCSSIRLLGSVGIGFGLSKMFEVETRPFWFALLTAGIVALVMETLLTLKALPRQVGSSLRGNS